MDPSAEIFCIKNVSKFSVEEWKPIRKVFNHAFNPTMLQNCMPTFVECSNKMVQSLSNYLDGTDFDLLKYVSIALLDTLMESTYGIEKSQEIKDEIYEKVVDSVEQ